MANKPWKNIVVSKLYHDQGGRCANCGRDIDADYQKQVVFKHNPARGGNSTDWSNLKLIHRNCRSAEQPRSVERAKIIRALFEKGFNLESIARTLGISVRTVYRHIKIGGNNLIMFQDVVIFWLGLACDILTFF